MQRDSAAGQSSGTEQRDRAAGQCSGSPRRVTKETGDSTDLNNALLRVAAYRAMHTGKANAIPDNTASQREWADGRMPHRYIDRPPRIRRNSGVFYPQPAMQWCTIASQCAYYTCIRSASTLLRNSHRSSLYLCRSTVCLVVCLIKAYSILNITS